MKLGADDDYDDKDGDDYGITSPLFRFKIAIPKLYKCLPFLILENR